MTLNGQEPDPEEVTREMNAELDKLLIELGVDPKQIQAARDQRPHRSLVDDTISPWLADLPGGAIGRVTALEFFAEAWDSKNARLLLDRIYAVSTSKDAKRAQLMADTIQRERHEERDPESRVSTTQGATEREPVRLQ